MGNTNKDVFSFCHVIPWETYRAILSVIKINSAVINGKCPFELNIPNVIPIFEKGNPFENANYKPISLLSSLSEV